MSLVSTEPGDEAAAVLAEVLGGAHLADAGDILHLTLPRLVAEDAPTTLGIEVCGWLLQAAARLYVIADQNRVPLLARIELRAGRESRHISIDVCLEASTHVRVVVALEDGSLRQAARWVWVLPRDAVPTREVPRT
jgi:hypothetical protein